MDANISNLFYIKRAKPNSKGLVPIFQRITVNSQRIEKSTGKYIDPDLWSPTTAKLKGKTDEARSINSHLCKLQNEVLEAEKDLTLHRREVNYVNMKSVLTGKGEKERTIVPIFQEHNDRIQALVPVGEFAQGTVERYKTTLNHFKSFLELKLQVKDITIDKIDYAFIMDFDFFLRTQRACKNNTSIKYVKNFQKIFNICLDNEWVTKDVFKKYKPKPTIVDRDYLTEPELQEVQSKRFATPRLLLVRDIFLFSCYTGLAYVDVQNLSPANISMGIDGSKWIFTNREKTDGPSHIPILPVVEELIEKYKNHPNAVNKNRVMPILSNQRMNSYLKEIADVCGINKELTFHIARHTFATTVTLSNGVPMESVSKMLGHRSLKSTQIYARVLDIKVSRDMQNLKNKLNSGTAKPAADKTA
ncbi:site-specific integrase [Flavobacterium wongokense]|uniref:site-specific integrase n=1 Tax=Flavobacterium wongokense TaxID=2910674 RepID=UPI001F2D8EB0|nr:site-specific integrase [Flavobacterium sp. WG47]MCF6132730.1 site-specific integrase [Flavobacterium sp. WG47]